MTIGNYSGMQWNRRRFVLLAVIGFAGGVLRAAPEGAALIEIIGTVAKATANSVDVMSGGQRLTLVADERTESWKGRTYRDFSQLEPGDSIHARCRKDEGGKLITVSLWANRIDFPGVISAIVSGKLEVLTDPSAHPQTNYQEMKVVDLAFDTVIEGGTKKDLRKGRSVQVTGVDLRNGSVRATRVILR